MKPAQIKELKDLVGRIAGDLAECKFAVGDRVEKFTGDYCWRGEVCSIFMTPNSKIRIVAHPVDAGYVLHIYAEDNLRMYQPHKSVT
jgi:hypothetical protein